MSQMHPDLMGASCFKAQLQQAVPAAPLCHLKMSNSLLAPCHHLTAVGLQRIPADGQIYRSRREFFLQQSSITADHSPVFAMQLPSCQHCLQLPLRPGSFGKQHTSCRIPVQPVQGTNRNHLSLLLEIICQIVGKGACTGLTGRVYQHPGRLVQHNHLSILVENLHPAFLRHHAIACILELADCHHISCL